MESPFKTCRCVCVPLLLMILASGCSSVASKELVSKRTSESFCLVLVRPSDPGLARLPVKIDDYKAKLASGSFLELWLSPGMHFLSARRGFFLSHDFPPADTNLSGSPGERRYFSYVMQFSMSPMFIPIQPSVFTVIPMQKPYQAAWKEISQQEFERQFPHAKFDHEGTIQKMHGSD